MEQVEVAGMPLDLYDRGSGPNLLYLHGEHFAGQAEPFLDRLARDFRVLAPRHPGFDGRTPPADFRRVDDLAYLYLDLVSQLGLGGLTLVGGSFGGWIALEMAVRDRGALERLALVGSTGVKFGAREERDIADLFYVEEAEVRRLLFHDAEANAPRYADLDDAAMEAIGRERQYAAWYGWQPYMHNPVLARWLHRVDLPALVLSGESDGYAAPAYGRELTRRLPQATYQEIAAAGHYPQIEQPEALAAAIAAFARR